jgi:hypothetical protein
MAGRRNKKHKEEEMGETGLDAISVVGLTADERLCLTGKPDGFGWSVTVLEVILTTLRKKGRCFVEVEGEASDEVPTLAEILF